MKKWFVSKSLKNQLRIIVAIVMVPFLIIAAYLLYALQSYSDAYDTIVSNMTIANNYNLEFKDELDENIYRIVVSGSTFEEATKDGAIVNPYELINNLRTDFQNLENITTDEKSRRWLQNLLRNIDTLEERVGDIEKNMNEGGHYDENIEMLDNNIYILTELIQDDIEYYIYYQTESIENLKTALNQQMVSFITYMVCIILAIIAALIYITSKLSKSIVNPIKELNRITNRIAGGDFNVRAVEGGGVEMAKLSGSVNDMAQHLEIMVDQIREDERKMRKSELRLLQEQINPHFLYNTLDTIVWLIEGGKNEEAEDMVVSLSNFFRSFLSHGKEFIRVEDEEKHIRSYLEIQQVRYRDILNYDIEIDPELYKYKIMKMTLQPLVENALYHGVKNKREGGTIKITGHLDGHLIRFVVRDDGAGMTPEDLFYLRDEIQKPCKETDTGFGMANVNERIRMYFGINYGIMIDSELGKGTNVYVTIPAELYDEGNRNED